MKLSIPCKRHLFLNVFMIITTITVTQEDSLNKRTSIVVRHQLNEIINSISRKRYVCTGITKNHYQIQGTYPHRQALIYGS